MSQASTFTSSTEQDLGSPVRERDHTRGPDDTPVTLVQYGDFECEECGDVYPVIKELRDQLGSQLQYVFRHFPLTEVHPRAKHAAEATEAAARVLLIFILTYTVAVGGLAHCIVSSVEVLYVVFNGGASISEFLWGFLAPATLGNTAGGVVLVALLNYSQTRERRIRNRDCRILELGWREWLFGNHIGQPITPSFSTSREDSTETD